MFPLVVRNNESLKKAKRMFSEAPHISESIAINEKFLSFQKQLEESTDKIIPDDLKLFFIQEVAGAMRKSCIAISREEEAARTEELFLTKNQLFSKN